MKIRPILAGAPSGARLVARIVEPSAFCCSGKALRALPSRKMQPGWKLVILGKLSISRNYPLCFGCLEIPFKKGLQTAEAKGINCDLQKSPIFGDFWRLKNREKFRDFWKIGIFGPPKSKKWLVRDLFGKIGIFRQKCLFFQKDHVQATFWIFGSKNRDFSTFAVN